MPTEPLIHEHHDVVSVHAPVSWYVIEPARFDLGLSRVEMVDYHLRLLGKDSRQYGEDSDALLEARVVFAGASQ